MKKLLSLLLALCFTASTFAIQATLLDGVATDTTGTSNTIEKTHWMFNIHTVGGSVGGTISLQFKEAKGNWVTFDTRSITNATDTVLTIDMPMRYVRAVLTSWSAGTWTVTVDAL